MYSLWMDVLNSDWHDWRGTGKDEDRLLKADWIMQMVARWKLSISNPPDASIIATFLSLRALILNILQKLLQQQEPSEEDIAALNAYLDAAPSRLRLEKADGGYQLQQVALTSDWGWVFREIAASFATSLVEHNYIHIKQCENSDCRWFYYDESWNQSRRWCEDSCANLIRVRRFRARRREKSHTDAS